jgi:hypothetical protein
MRDYELRVCSVDCLVGYEDVEAREVTVLVRESITDVIEAHFGHVYVCQNSHWEGRLLKQGELRLHIPGPYSCSYPASPCNAGPLKKWSCLVSWP